MPDTIEQDLECLLEIQKKIEENKRPVVSQTEIDKILNAVKTHSHKKELALEPFSPGQTWGVRVLRIDQQPPGMPPEVQAVLSVSSLDLPRGCPLTNFWPDITSEANLAALGYALRPELRDIVSYEY